MDIIKIKERYNKRLLALEEDIKDFELSGNAELEMSVKTLKPEAERLKIVIGALEKQIELKPIYTDEGNICPNCKSHIYHEQQTMFCRQCGQKVYWG